MMHPPAPQDSPLHTSDAIPRERTNARRVNVIGAGIAGTWQALKFAEAGCDVSLYERGDESMAQATSHSAGGMLAPFCEAEGAEPLITRLGLRSLDLWREALPDTPMNGSLVVAHPRDRADYFRFEKLTHGHRRVDATEIAALEPDLAGRFAEGLFFPQEGHVEPRRALPALHDKLREAGVPITFRADPEPADLDGTVIDCRGLAARDAMPKLRGVKGEFVIVESTEVSLARPVRLIHPRWPLYVIPRADHRFMVGATSLETEDDGMSVRAALELLSAAYALHPSFAEARIVEFGTGLRPALPDNLPRVEVGNARITVNGLYRHGFLIAPAVAEATVAHVLRGESDPELIRWN